MSVKPFRPMLACETPEDLESLNQFFPMYGSYKLDGIRAIVRNGVLVSRTLKPIRSAFAQKFAMIRTEGLDGELLVPKQHGPTIYHDTDSAVMTFGSMEPLNFWVFDRAVEGDFIERHHWLTIDVGRIDHPHIKVLEQRDLRNVQEILDMEEEALTTGHEGLILRRKDAPYKYGRSSPKEAYLVKIKRFKDAEAVVVGFTELMHNQNEKKTDALGLSKRSTHQANKVSSGMLGALVCRMPGYSEDFNIGIGFDHSLRKEIFENQPKYLGRYVKFKFQEYGTKDAPRVGVFLGWRSPEDM